MRLRPMWPMYGTYIATLLGLALMNILHSNKGYYQITRQNTVITCNFMVAMVTYVLKKCQICNIVTGKLADPVIKILPQ
jgi:hypothetical protein